MIAVQLERNSPITQMDERGLQKIEGLLDNENERTTWVEYCLINCEGAAHRTSVAESASFFCSKHVHRSAHVTLKKPIAAFGEIESFRK